MFGSNPVTNINALFVLVVVSLLAIGWVLFRLRNDHYPTASYRYFLPYFATGILLWIVLWLKTSLFPSLGYSPVVVLYVLASLFLLLAVLNYQGKPRLPITIMVAHVIVIVGGLFAGTLFQAALVEGVYTLVVYAAISIIALKRAYRNRNFGIGIVGLASILAFVVAPVQLYGALVSENIGLIAVASSILQPTAFVLVGVGFMGAMLRHEQARHEQLALREPLTGLYSRHGMVHAVEIPLALLRRNGGYIGAIAFTIDSFEKINDDFGQDAGDMVLVKVAEIIRVNTRDSDVACFLGGDRFVVLLPGESVHTDLVAERLRKAVENAGLSHQGAEIKCTSSLGVASQFANKDFEYLLNNAETAMQRAITEGGNRISRDGQ
jgi:diguanylate cyclase (GGDEF)-like protein